MLCISNETINKMKENLCTGCNPKGLVPLYIKSSHNSVTNKNQKMGRLGQKYNEVLAHTSQGAIFKNANVHIIKLEGWREKGTILLC